MIAALFLLLEAQKERKEKKGYIGIPCALSRRNPKRKRRRRRSKPLYISRLLREAELTDDREIFMHQELSWARLQQSIAKSYAWQSYVINKLGIE